MTRKAKTINELADEYGISRSTMYQYIYEDDELMISLKEAHWQRGRRLLPLHQDIIYEYFGAPDFLENEEH
jgi:ACT domain-containing protein